MAVGRTHTSWPTARARIQTGHLKMSRDYVEDNITVIYVRLISEYLQVQSKLRKSLMPRRSLTHPAIIENYTFLLVCFLDLLDTPIAPRREAQGSLSVPVSSHFLVLFPCQSLPLQLFLHSSPLSTVIIALMLSSCIIKFTTQLMQQQHFLYLRQ